MIGLSCWLCPSDGGLLGKATTPGTATMRGAIDLAISCWVRSRSPQGFSRTTERALRHRRVAGHDEHAVGLGNREIDLLELLGVSVGIFDGRALGRAEHHVDVALVLDRRELALQLAEEEIARASDRQTEQKHRRGRMASAPRSMARYPDANPCSTRSMAR